MPSASQPGNQLRERAAALRRLAHAIEDADAVTLHRRATTDTWIGPTPQRCHDDLVAARTSLLGAAADVRSAAFRLDRLARQLDAAVVRATVS
jgi:hypothetical protein